MKDTQKERSGKKDDHSICVAYFESAGSKRPLFFLRMQAVALPVCNIIHGVDYAGHKAEGKTCLQRLHKVVKIEQVLGKNKRRKDQAVLDPLNGPQEANDCTYFMFQESSSDNSAYVRPNRLSSSSKGILIMTGLPCGQTYGIFVANK